MSCWLAQFSDRACEGPLEPAHLISKQTLKREGHHNRVWDTRLWRPACRLHHANFDNHRLTVPYESLPWLFLSFCEELGLSYYVDRRFRPHVEALARKPAAGDPNGLVELGEHLALSARQQ